MNKGKESEIIKKFNDASQIKNFQLFCAKQYDTIPNVMTIQRWIEKKASPNAAFACFLRRWSETDAR